MTPFSTALFTFFFFYITKREENTISILRFERGWGKENKCGDYG